MVCPVCDGSGKLLDEVCPLCDGVDEASEDDEPQMNIGAIEEECDSEAEIDDAVLFCQDGENDDGSIMIPCAVSTEFFYARFFIERYVPIPKFGVELSVLGVDQKRIGADVWCTFSDLTALATSSFVDSLRVLDGLALTPSNFLECKWLPKRLRSVPPTALLCQLFAMAEAWRLRIRLDESFCASQEVVCWYFDWMCDELGISAHNVAPLLSAKEVLPRVYHVETASRLILASAFVRFQEHYEGQSERFRRQSFTLDDFRTWYREDFGKQGRQATQNDESPGPNSATTKEECSETRREDDVSSKSFSAHGWNYYLNWPGFNDPSWVLLWCRDNLTGGMRPQEQALLDVVLPLAGADATSKAEKVDPFYVIGTCLEDTAATDDDNLDENTLFHEMAHGLYFTNQDYKVAVQAELAKLPAKTSQNMKWQLFNLGYCDDPEIIEDEKQAYLVSGGLLAEFEYTGVVREVALAVGDIWERFTGLQLKCPDGGTPYSNNWD